MKSIICVFFIILSCLSCQSQAKKVKLHPIVIAIKNGNLETVKKMIQTEVDLNKHYEPGYTPLCTAIKFNQLKIVVFLINQGADPKIMSNKKTPLMFAAKYGHLAIAKLLIEKGADKRTLSPKGLSALDYAYKYDKAELVTLLQKK